nr:MAG TPA: hypothetical protein [Caudoviricetes sp.]
MLVYFALNNPPVFLIIAHQTNIINNFVLCF